MAEVNKPQENAVKQVIRKPIALRALCTKKGMVKKGDRFACTESEYNYFRTVGAI